jgi:uncharacterized LabA/DUF88 family protein
MKIDNVVTCGLAELSRCCYRYEGFRSTEMIVHNGTGYMSPREVSYLFVDAGALRAHLDNITERFFPGQKFHIDVRKLRGRRSKVFYYDALPVREQGELEADYRERIREQQDVLDEASSIDGVHVYEGDAHRRRKRGLEQKKVDVMIAVDMLTHTFRGNMHKAALLTGDNDFKPLIDALVREGMFVTLIYPPGHTNKELINAADSRVGITLPTLRGWLKEGHNFDVPMPINRHPSLESGIQLKEWREDGVRMVLCKDGGDFLFLRDGDESNRLNIRHSNLELLKLCCTEYGWKIDYDLEAGADGAFCAK